MIDDPFDMASGGGVSDEFEVDLSESKSGAVDEGIYLLQVLSVEKGVSNNGNPMWIWDFSILHDDKGGTKFAGRQPRPEHTVLTASALWKLEELLLALGCVESPGQTYRGKKQDLLGRKVWGAIKNSEYNGRQQSNVQAYQKYVPGKAPVASSAQAKKGPSGPSAAPAAKSDNPFD